MLADAITLLGPHGSRGRSRATNLLHPRLEKQGANVKDKFTGKVAVITGGSTGIGLATAKRFVQEGMDHVFISGRRKDALERAVAEIARNVTAVAGDVSNLTDLDRLYAEVARHNRKIDVFFANAGVAQLAPIEAVDEKFYDLHFDANVKGLFFTVQKALPLMNDGGSIILTGSIAKAVSSLASDEASYITGIELYVDGGVAQI